MAAFNSNYLFPNEGLDYILNIFPRGTNSLPSGTYMGLFSTPWSTIQASGTPNVTLNGVANSSAYFIQEANFTGYSRQFIPSGATYWTAPIGASFTVSGTVSGQTTTTNSGYTFSATATGTVYGIFISNSGTAAVTSSGTGNGTNPTVIWYAPFSDLNAVTVASGDSITVTPTWQFAPNAG